MVEITSDELQAQSRTRLENISRPLFGALSSPIKSLALIDAVITAYVEHPDNSPINTKMYESLTIHYALMNELVKHNFSARLDVSRATAEVCIMREKEGLAIVTDAHWTMLTHRIQPWIDIFKALTIEPQMLPYIEVGITDVKAILKYIEADIDPQLATHLNRI